MARVNAPGSVSRRNTVLPVCRISHLRSFSIFNYAREKMVDLFTPGEFEQAVLWAVREEIRARTDREPTPRWRWRPRREAARACWES